VPHKWNITERINDLHALYGKPVHILYFGDYDEKGLQIPESAMADIREWVTDDVDLHYTRCGIDPEHVERFDIPENNAAPGTYQWEALSDAAASTVIEESLSGSVDTFAILGRINKAKAATEKLQRDVRIKLRELVGGAS
jgi:hypothetical protein